MSDLTDDEFVVLSLAAAGHNMMAIARWEKPADTLVRRGFLVRHDKFNHEITAEGRVAIERHEANIRQQGTELLAAESDTRAKALVEANLAVEHLILAAKFAASATGDTLEYACRQWAEQIMNAAIRKIGQ